MSSLISARIDDTVSKKLEQLSKETNRSKSFLASQAIEKYIEEQSWQIAAIKEGISEADKNNFATDEEVKNFFSKWGIDEN